jgi:hypothetical membrane protein
MIIKPFQRNKFGAILWVLNLQYFIVQLIVASAWATHFSLRTNYISDLGNTVCGMYSDRYVCSPDHLLMNISFVVVGLTQLVGAVVLLGLPKTSRVARAGYVAMILAGIGTMFVGFFPENTIAAFHTGGATLPFLIGNFGPLLVAYGSRTWPKWLKRYSYVSTGVGLSALVFFMTAHYGWLAAGGVERVVAYPQTIWMIVVGGVLLRRSRS